MTGDGSSGTPYVVAAPADLQLVGVGDCLLSAHYRQTADIDLSGAFTQIGSVVAPFTGTYRGASAATRIAGLVLSNTDVNASGTILALFAATQGATIEDLTIHHPRIDQRSTGLAAALIGDVRGASSDTTTVRRVTVTNPSVDGRQDVGGLIGRAAAPVLVEDVTVTTASIQPTGDFNGSAGGLIGATQASATIRRVTLTGNLGNIAPTERLFETVGAIIGTAAAAPGAGLVLEDITVGSADATFVRAREFAGGMIGILTGSGSASIGSSGTRRQLHVNIKTLADAPRASSVGGVIGRVRDGANLSISKVEVTGNLTDNAIDGVGTVGQLGGIIGDYASPFAAATLTIDDVRVVPSTMWGGAAVGGAIGSAAAETGNPLTVTVSDSTFASDSVRAYSTMSELGGVIGRAGGADLTVSITNAVVHGTIEQWSQGPLGGAIGRATGGVFTVTGLVVGSSTQLASLRSRGPAPFSGTAGVVGSLTGGRLTVDDADVNVDLRLIGDAVGGQNVAGILGSAAVPIASEVLLRGVRVRGHLEAASLVAGLVAAAPSVPLDPAVPSLRVASYTPTGGGAPIRSRVDATILTTSEEGSAAGAVAGASVGTMRAEITGLDVTATTTITAGTAGGVVGAGSGAGSRLVVDDVTVAALVDASGENFSRAGGIVAVATDVSITSSTVSGTVRSTFLGGGFVGSVSETGAALTITGGAFSGTVRVEAGSGMANAEVFAGGLVGRSTAVPTITGTVGTGAAVRVNHQSGTAFGTVYLAGAVAQVTAAGATVLDTSSMAGMQVAELDANLVSTAIRNAGRCIVSDRANLITGTTLVRSRPLSPDPCPAPAGGFTIFDDSDDDDDDDDTSSTSTGTAGGADPTGVSLACSASAPAAGSNVTCTVAGAPADIEILWEVRRNPVVATGVVRTDASGSGELTFRVPDLPAGTTLAVVLVAWTSPLLITIAGPVPSGIPAGEGLGAVPPMSGRTAGLLALLLGLALAVGSSVAPGREHAHQG